MLKTGNIYACIATEGLTETNTRVRRKKAPYRMNDPKSQIKYLESLYKDGNMPNRVHTAIQLLKERIDEGIERET